MEELLGMSDRIVVLSEGKLTGELQRDEFDQAAILKLAGNSGNLTQQSYVIDRHYYNLRAV